jgi:3,4-dihydroxy 2-butanone 4-phosphate synthase/GTP cyclohydrolase II
MSFATIPEILAEIRAGRMVVVVDDEDRENEGDLIMAAELVRPADINFMVTHARGLVCLSLAQPQLSFPPELVAPTRWGNTSVTRVEAERPYRVQLVNCTAHLDAASADGHTRSGL